MQFLVILAMTIGLASAADVCKSSSNSGCSGNRVCCVGIQQGGCCNLSGNRNTVRYTLPANSRGQGWSGSGCSGSSATTSTVNAVTDWCITYNWNVPSAAWLQGRGKRSADEVEVEEDLANCLDPNGAVYELDGAERKVKIPEGQVDLVSSWIDNGEWEKLGALENYE